MPRLSPGKAQFVKSARDLHPSIFRRLVARRARACDHDGDFPLTAREVDRRRNEKLILEKVSGTADFLPSRYLTLGAARSEAVCRLVVPTSRGRSFGTGFLIAPGVIMTNNHVIGDEDEGREAMAEFRYEEGSEPIVVAARPERLFVTNKTLDFTIIAVEGRGLEGISPIALRRDSTLITRHERANIIQHPNRRRKEVALRNNPVTRVKDKVLHYRTDTEGGSSGSPVFNDNWDLVALHHAGVANRDGTATNEGIRISAIVDYLVREFSREESSGARDELKAVLDGIQDSSPLLGFFDSHGIELGELEVQVDDFQGTAEFADIGAWNIEHFNRGVSDEKVEAVADVVERLGLDVFGLTEVQAGALDRLSNELGTRGGRYDYVLHDARGSQDIAVLFDTDTTEATKRADIAQRHRSLLSKKTAAGKTAFPRWPLFVECHIDAVQFIMIVVHLKAFGDQHSRARRKLASECLSQIIEDVRTTERMPVVLCGDFNARIDSDALAPLAGTPDLLSMTVDDEHDGAISYVGDRHRSLIDHIMVTADAQLGEIQGDDVAIVRLDRSVADFAALISDHVPLVFRMLLREEPIDVPDGEEPTDVGIEIAIPEGSQVLEVDFR